MAIKRALKTSKLAAAQLPAVAGSMPAWAIWAMSFALALSVVVAFSPSFGAGFVNFDDDIYVSQHAMVLHGLTWKGIEQAFHVQVKAGYWIPLTWLSFMLDTTLFGTKPFGFHLTNVLLHAANSALLFVFLRMATGAFWRSAVATMLFAIHPLRVESVTWITERKDVLSGFFGLLALLAYVRYARSGRWPWMAAVCIGFVLSLMAKGMTLMLPMLVCLLDFWPLGRWPARKDPAWSKRVSKLALEKAPLLIIALLGVIETTVAQSMAGAIAGTRDISLLDRIFNAIVSYVRYLGKAAWPSHLAVFYPFFGDWSALVVLLCATLLAGLTYLAWQQRRQRPGLFVGWLWFVIAFLPMIGILQVGAQAMADRFSYFPMMGLVLAAVWALPLRWPRQTAVATAFVILILATLTWRQCEVWHSSITLWTSDLEATDDNDWARFHLGTAYYEENRVDEAITNYQKALTFKVENARVPLGRALLKSGRRQEAAECLQKALANNPSSAEACEGMGELLFAEKDYANAADLFERAARLDETDWRPMYNLGYSSVYLNKLATARDAFDEALRRGIDDPMIEGKATASLARLNEALHANGK